jgi:hypothetical protein
MFNFIYSQKLESLGTIKTHFILTQSKIYHQLNDEINSYFHPSIFNLQNEKLLYSVYYFLNLISLR